MTNDEETMQAIQQRMREVRRELGHDLAISARDITDWRSYVRASPWLAVASAAALGYLLAPKGPPVVRLNSIDLQRLVENGHTTATVASVPKAKKSLAMGLVSSLAGLAARAALAHITQRLTSVRQQTEEKTPF
jgi:hypothetical protein